jgi:adenine deaminase
MTAPDRHAVALGEAPADLVVTGGEVVLVERGAVESRDVVVVDDRIVALPTTADDVIGPDTRVVDATGRHVAPGFVDAHAHVDSPQTIETAYHHSLCGGTTSVVTETSDLCSGAGPAALEAHLAATADLPLTVFPTVPPQWFYDRFEPQEGEACDRARLADALAHDRVVGVGEVDWIFVTGRASPVEALLERAATEGVRVCGHGAGCRGGRYAAFASVVDSDHEAIEPAGVRERLDAGVHVIGRCGTARDDVAAVAAVVRADGVADVSLSTDGLDLRDLRADGHVDRVVRRAIEAGIDPIDAIRMATVVPARHFRLGRRGTLAPGSVADVVVLDDLERVTVDTVVADGEVVVAGGEPRVGPRPHDYPADLVDAGAASLAPDRFAVPASRAVDGAVRAIGYTNGFYTPTETVSPARRDGRLEAAPERGVLKAALLCRRPDSERADGFTGFLTGYGLADGAAATSVTRERPGVAVVGADDDAMYRAVERVVALGGGWVVADEGRIVAELPLPIGGVATDAPSAETAAALDAVERALRERGVAADRPLIGIESLSFPGVPELKLSFSGYADVAAGRIVGLEPPA